MSSIKPWLSALAVTSATFVWQTPAQAQSCASDADCGAGYACRTETYQSCWGSSSCNEDGECTMEEGGCVDVESSYCTNATCGNDSDCPDHMACQEQTRWECEGGGMSGSAGAGGASGSAAPDAGWQEPTCEELPADSLCVPRHQLPCEVAADCGGGFNCVESTYWQCGGMGGSGGGVAGMGVAGTGAGGAPAQDAGSSDGEGMTEVDGGSDYECEEVPSGTSYCQLQDLPCETNADCPLGLECGEQYSYPPCEGTGVGGAGGTSGTSGMGSVEVDAGASYYCPDPIVQQRCMPESYEGGGGMGGVGGGGSGGSSGEQDAGVGEGEGGSGSAGMGGAENPDDDGDSDEKPRHGKGKKLGWLKKLFGCSTTGATTSEGGMSWLALGLAAFALRRRTRKA